MKKIITLSIIFTFASIGFLKAQDLIFLKDGSKIEAKINEVTPQKVKYKKFINLEGPVYILDKSEIIMISYENGKNETFNKTADKEEKPKEEKEAVNLGRNLVTYHLFDIVFNDFTLSYERISENGMMSFQIPIGIGFNYNESYAYGDYSNKFYSGFGVNFFPLGQGTWRYFVGPSLRLGIGRASYYHSGTAPDWIGWTEDKEFFYGKLLINNGLMYTPVPNMTLSAVGSLGIKYFDIAIDDYTPRGVYSSAHFAINMSYRF